VFVGDIIKIRYRNIYKIMKNKDYKHPIDSLSSVVKTIGKDLDKKEIEYILNEIGGLVENGGIPSQEKEIFAKAHGKLFDGLIRLILGGHEFVDPSRIKSKFGNSLEEGLPGSSSCFLNFAKGYWTFFILLNDLRKDNHQYIAFNMLSQIEVTIASTFFPTPGPFPKVAYTEKNQRRFLSKFDIDIDDFMKGNPVLQKKSRSPLAVLIIMIIVVVLLILIFKF